MMDIDNRIAKAILLLTKDLNLDVTKDGLKLKLNKGYRFSVQCTISTLIINYIDDVQIYRGLGLAVEKYQECQTFVIKESPYMTTCGPMFDMSQNGVMLIQAIKKMINMSALMGLNRIYLYLEDIYEVKGLPYFGYMRGAYSKDELRSIDDYAYQFGIEVVPIIQTLGHLQTVLRWHFMDEMKDTPDILLAGQASTYKLISKLIQSITRCFRTNQVHLGMDESTKLGLGQYLRQNGYKQSQDIMMEHLENVCQIAKDLGCEPMIWSDMFFRMCSSKGDYYDPQAVVTKSVQESIPANLSLVYWDYYHHHIEHYDSMISRHQQLCDNIFFAGAIWTWNSGATNYKKTFDTLSSGLISCKKNGIKDVIITLWGDDGTENNYFSALLGIQYAAEHCYRSDVKMEDLKKRFKTCTGGDYDLFMLMNGFDVTPGTDYMSGDAPIYNPSKYSLWQDLLVGLFDKNLSEVPVAEHYTSLANTYNTAVLHDEWTDIHKHYLLLATTLSQKTDLGILIKELYDDQNKEKLKQIVVDRIPELKKSVKALLASHKKLWFDTYKSFGWEVMDGRYGGLIQRIQSTSDRLSDYIEGRVESVEELETQRLPYNGGFSFNDQWMLTENRHAHIVTACQFTHNPGG